MKKENLVKRLGRKVKEKVLPYVLSGFLALGGLGGLSAHYGCSDNFTDPNSPDSGEPDEPVIMQPIARLSADPKEGTVQLRVYFDASKSTCDPNYYIKEYHLDFDGDGITDRISGYPQAYYTYEKTGKYKPTLFVKDSKEQISNKVSLEIMVTEELVSLSQIAFLHQDRSDPDRYYEDIYSGEIIRRVKDNKIELRNIERLTTDPGQDFQPAWSSDGKYLAWITNRDGFNSIYVMKEDGADKRKLTPPINMSFWRPSWSPDGTEIAFAYIDRDLSTNGIGKINIDGSGLTKLFENQGAGTLPSGSWSNDGRIFYHDYVGGNWDIFSINSDGSGLPERITNTPYGESLPSVSPVGDRLIFLSDQFGSSDIFSANLDGTNVERITTDSGVETDPAWSPDGTQIIFAYDAPLLFNPQLYLVNSDGIGEWIQLTFDWANRHPAWKPEIED